MEAVQCCMVLLDDENRDILQHLLLFLNDMAKKASLHKMDAKNLAICLAPSLLNIKNSSNERSTATATTNSTAAAAAVDSVNGQLIQIGKCSASIINMNYCNASVECLEMMIENARRIFEIPSLESATATATTMNHLQHQIRTDHHHHLAPKLDELFGSSCWQSNLGSYFNFMVEQLIKVNMMLSLDFFMILMDPS